MALPPVSLKPKRQRRRGPAIPKKIRSEVAQFVYGLAGRYRNQFTPELKAKVLRLLRALLPPRRKRGRPRDPAITRAGMLFRRFRRRYPHESRYEIWNRVCLILIPGYAVLSELDQRAACENLQARVKSRVDLIRSRRKRQQKNRAQISA
jgi:hypothetical protein